MVTKWGTKTLPTSMRAPPSTEESAWFQLSPQREKDIIAFAMKHKPDLTSVDCSQRIDRTTMEVKGILPTITPNAKHFLGRFPGMGGRPLNRFIFGVESLAFQGFPVELLAGTAANTSDRQCQDLAGNAFPSTCLLAIMLAMLVHAPRRVWMIHSLMCLIRRPRWPRGPTA